MFTSRRLIVVATAVALLSGCASPNPYDNQGQASTESSGMSKTAKYGGLGALAGRWPVRPSVTITAVRAH